MPFGPKKSRYINALLLELGPPSHFIRAGSQGLAFVDFEDEVSAAAALLKTDGMKLKVRIESLLMISIVIFFINYCYLMISCYLALPTFRNLYKWNCIRNCFGSK